jgi:hypothetical protein
VHHVTNTHHVTAAAARERDANKSAHRISKIRRNVTNYFPTFEIQNVGADENIFCLVSDVMSRMEAGSRGFPRK